MKNMASKKYMPILIGVEHSDANLEATKKAVDSVAGQAKSIAIEGIWPETIRAIEFVPWRNSQLVENGLKRLIVSPAAKRRSANYTAELALHAAKKGLKLVSIDSLVASTRGAKWLKKSEDIQKKLNDIKEHGTEKYSASELMKLIKETSKITKKADMFNLTLRDEFMVKRIKKFRPDIILVGISHAPAIKKNFRLKQKPIIIASQELLRTKAWQLRLVSIRNAVRRMQLALYRKKMARARKRR